MPLLASFSRASRLDVLVYAEEVPGIILFLDRRETFVVVAISGLNPILPFFHHEIHIGATRGVGMESAPIISGPVRDDLLVRRIGIDTPDHRGVGYVTIAEGGVRAANTMDCTVDGIDVHG